MKSLETPLLDGLKKYIEEDNISFHTPGHKGDKSLTNWTKYIPYMDLTEVEGLDNIHDPKGIILESQKLAASAFKAKETFYSVNGTTGGLYIALRAVTNPGDKILIQRNCHKSIYNGAILNRLNLTYVYPKYNEKYKLTTGIDPKDVEKYLEKYSDIKAVVITYPSYYGICSDIERIAEIVHKYDKILLVDEAHGSHFVFSEKLPKTALEGGADIVVQSTHKTLPSFTQSSMIHVGSHRIDIEKLKSVFSLYQTTSPSYVLMASLDVARAYMEKYGKEKLNLLISNIEFIKNNMDSKNRIFIFSGDREDKTIYDLDVTKILINIKGIIGSSLEKILRKEYNIQLEMSDYYYGLALTTVMNDKDDLNRLSFALEEIAQNRPYEKIFSFNIEMPTPKVRLPLWEAFDKEKTTLSLRESIGKISGSFVVPYPPGIPILCPGEEITEEIISKIEFLNQNHIEILGLLDYNRGKIEVIK